MPAQDFRVGAVTIGPAGRDRAPMWDEAAAGIRRAAAAGARLVVLPELFALPYVAGDDPGRWHHLAEPVDGPTAQWAGELARDLAVTVLFSAAIARSGRLPLNCALLAGPDGRCRPVAEKIHLPPPADGDVHGEADHFGEGTPDIRPFAVGPIRVAALICYDRRFPECWRLAAAGGADLVAVMVAGPAPEPEGLYLGELRTHAKANAVYALAAARTGTELILGRPVVHDGLSAAIGPDGGLIAVGDARPGDVGLLDIDPARLAAARAGNPTARRLRLPH